MVSRWYMEEPDVEQPVAQMGPSINYVREFNYADRDRAHLDSKIAQRINNGEVALGSSVNWKRQTPSKKATPQKGKVGTIEKVIEEVEELCEAHVDEDPALVLTEVSDVVGALMCYVAENFPKTDFDALVRRAKAKNKAKGDKK